MAASLAAIRFARLELVRLLRCAEARAARFLAIRVVALGKFGLGLRLGCAIHVPVFLGLPFPVVEFHVSLPSKIVTL